MHRPPGDAAHGADAPGDAAVLPLVAGDRGRARGDAVGYDQRAAGAAAEGSYKAVGQDAEFASASGASAARGTTACGAATAAA